MLKKLLKQRNKKGFTLIELIVVLVIMAILAAAAIPTMMGYVNNAKKSTYLANCRAIYVAGQAAITEARANNVTFSAVDAVINPGATTEITWAARVETMTEMTGLAAKLSVTTTPDKEKYGITFDAKGNITAINYCYNDGQYVTLTPGSGTNVMD